MRPLATTLFGIVLISFSFWNPVLSEPKILELRWPDMSGADKAAERSEILKPSMSIMSEQDEQAEPDPRAQLANIKLPVLLPAMPFMSRASSVVSETYFYDVTIPLERARILVSGDRYYQHDISDKLNIPEQAMEDTPQFTRSDGIVEVNFNRYGANYTIIIECDKPQTDERCLKTDFLKEVYESLEIVGGRL